jgi:hypothetical protein
MSGKKLNVLRSGIFLALAVAGLSFAAASAPGYGSRSS